MTAVWAPAVKTGICCKQSMQQNFKGGGGGERALGKVVNTDVPP